MNRETDLGVDPVKLAGILCRDKDFHKFLMDIGNILEASEKEVVDWMRSELGVASRSELRGNQTAAQHLIKINEEFKLWKQSA